MNVRNPFQLGLFLVGAFFIVSGCECRGGRSLNQPQGELQIFYPNPDNLESQLSGREAVYEFGTVYMGQSKTATVKIQNFGRGTLVLEKMEYVSGDRSKVGDENVGEAPPAPVFEVKFKPRTELAALESLDLELAFSPPQNDDVSLKQVDHDLVLHVRTLNEASQEPGTLTIKGRGVSGVCEIPAEINFGSVAVTDTSREKFTLRNPTFLDATAVVGDVNTTVEQDRLAFAFSAEAPRGSVVLSPNSNREVTLEFTPTETRGYLAFLDVQASDGCPFIKIKLIGTGVDTVLTWTPSPLEFDSVTPPNQVVKTLTFKNGGNAQVTLSKLKITGEYAADYKVAQEGGGTAPTTVVVPGRGEKAIVVVFKPGSFGRHNATLNFDTTLRRQATGAVTLKGYGGGPDIEVKPSPILNFGKIAYFPDANTFQTRKLTVRNVGTNTDASSKNANLKLGKGGMRPYFELKPLAGTQAGEIELTVPSAYNAEAGIEAVAGRDLLDLIVKVTPKSLGKKQAEIVIHSNDPDEPETKILVTAEAAALPPCNYVVTPSVLEYGVVTPPSYKDLSFTLTNLGEGAGEECLLSGLDLGPNSAGEFSLPNGPIDAQTLAPKARLTVLVRAWPQKLEPSQALKSGTVEFYMSSPTKPQATVSLSALVASSCLTILPDSISFGTVQVGCNSTSKTITVYNTCSSDVTLKDLRVQSPGGQPAGGPNCTGTVDCPEFFQLNPGIPATGLLLPKPDATGTAKTFVFSARYKPIDLGPDTGAIALKVGLNGQDLTYVITLNGKGDTAGQNTDVFRQDNKPKADILLVIDNSGSMLDEQQSLADNFASFIRYADSRGIDYNIAVTTTDMTKPTQQGRFQFGPGHPEKIINSSIPADQRPARFAAKVNVGAVGSGVEREFAPALAALTAPLIVGENAGFLRDEANLAIVAVTDEPEQSAQPQSYYFNAFMNIKGFHRANMFSFNAIFPIPPCSGSLGGVDVRLNDMVTQTNGVKESICTQDWAKALEQLGKTAFGYRTNFFLNAVPDLAGHAVEVRVNGQIVPQTDPRGAKIWAYDPVANSVNFEPLFVPEPGQTLSITYNVICVP
ncbi:MAG: choice-of-anchor D domain-containing protein [Myxococcaceae bacterium]